MKRPRQTNQRLRSWTKEEIETVTKITAAEPTTGVMIGSEIGPENEREEKINSLIGGMIEIVGEDVSNMSDDTEFA